MEDLNRGQIKNVVVVIFDGFDDASGCPFAMGAKATFPTTVPVVFGFGDPLNHSKQFIGSATLRRITDQSRAELRADIVWYGDFLDELKVLPRLYLSIDGHIIEKKDKFVTEVKINKLHLHVTPNADPRIGPWTMYQLLGELESKGEHLRDQ